MVWYMFLLVGSAIAQDSGLFELNVIHYNDFHAHFDEVSPTGTVCNPSVAPCVGGFARLYTAIMEGLEAEPESLLLNGGDSFQGTMWYNFLRWNVTQHFMNLLPHDAHVLGNHEFDHGVEGLVPYLERLKSPMLGANVNTTGEPSMTPYIKNHIIVERHGRRIGIIGVLLQQFSASIGQVIVENELEAINREAAILTDLGVDIIIVLSHVGYSSDLALAARVSPTVDLIVGAHSHTLLYNGDTPTGDRPLGQYPTVVEQANGHRIPVVQASCYTRYLGNIKLFINDKGLVERWEGLPVYLGTSIVPDPNILVELEPWRQEVDAKGKAVLGTSRVTLNRSTCTRGECILGSWVCDGFLEELMLTRLSKGWNDVDVCLVNAGGLRVQIDSGDVTTESLLMAMPFENYIQVYDLKGIYLQQALEFSVGVSWTGTFSSSRMLQIGGIRIAVNASEPVGSRVTATVRCTDCDVPRYLPLDVDKSYKIVSQNYIGDGGSGFTVLAEHRENLENLGVDYLMVQRYMQRQKIVVKDLDGRIQVVY